MYNSLFSIGAKDTCEFSQQNPIIPGFPFSEKLFSSTQSGQKSCY